MQLQHSSQVCSTGLQTKSQGNQQVLWKHGKEGGWRKQAKQNMRLQQEASTRALQKQKIQQGCKQTLPIQDAHCAVIKSLQGSVCVFRLRHSICRERPYALTSACGSRQVPSIIVCSSTCCVFPHKIFTSTSILITSKKW
jgi:hypothetical protein